MRGKVEAAVSLMDDERITPAHAGKSRCCLRPAERPQDHPRACGEKLKVAHATDSLEGSPPRMRGKVAGLVAGRVFPGITPAHAGKRSRYDDFTSDGGDHPRACGEKSMVRPTGRPYRGSPPRMRGKGIQIMVFSVLVGITPAHAGKSVLVAVWAVEHGDHPRACGEKTTQVVIPNRVQGSPPRMRGKD